MRRASCAASAGMGRTTLLADRAGDGKNCKWIYRFGANPGMPRGGVLPPAPGPQIPPRKSPPLPSARFSQENIRQVPATPPAPVRIVALDPRSMITCPLGAGGTSIAISGAVCRPACTAPEDRPSLGDQGVAAPPVGLPAQGVGVADTSRPTPPLPSASRYVRRGVCRVGRTFLSGASGLRFTTAGQECPTYLANRPRRPLTTTSRRQARHRGAHLMV